MSFEHRVIVDSSSGNVTGTPENYEMTMEGEAIRRVSGFSVVGAMVPKSVPHYGLPGVSDSFVFRWNSTNNTVFLPDVSGSAPTGDPQLFTTLAGVATALQTALRDQITADLSVSSDLLTGRLTITDASSARIEGFVTIPPLLRQIFGFNEGLVTATQNFTSPKVVDLTAPRYLRFYVSLNGRPILNTVADTQNLMTGIIPFAGANNYQVLSYTRGDQGAVTAPNTAGYQSVSRIGVRYALPDGTPLPAGAFQGVDNQLELRLYRELQGSNVGYGKRRRA